MMLRKLAGLLRRFSRDTKIYHKLITSILLMIVIPMLFLSGIYIVKLRAVVESELSNSYVQVVGQYLENVNYKFTIYQNLSDTIAGNTTVQQIFSGQSDVEEYDVYTLSSLLAKEIDSLMSSSYSRDIKSIMLYSLAENFPSDGKHIASVVSVEGEKWYQDMAQGGNEFYFYSATAWSGERFISVVRPIYDLSGRVLRRKLGYIKIDILADSFFNANNPDNGGKFSAVCVLDAQGQMIYSAGAIPAEHIAGALAANLPLDGRRVEAAARDGAKELQVQRRIKNNGWNALFYFPYSEIESRVMEVGRLILITVLILMAVFTTMSVLLSRSFSSRIMQLVRKMARVERGDLEVKEVIDGKDEIGILDDHFNRMVMKLRQSIHDNYIGQLEKREAELTALQAQINPHFLYNTLEAISSMAAEHGVQPICTVCQKLGEMFRYSINIHRKEFVTLTEELKHIENYFVIQKIRFDNQFDVFFDIPEELRHCKILKFILQPIVENALYHGFEEKRGKGFLEISARREDKVLILKVQDDGVGMTPEQVERLNRHINDIDQNVMREFKGSIGVRNVNSRIKLAYGSEYGITVNSEYQVGTEVILKLPFYGVAEENGDVQDPDR